MGTGYANAHALRVAGTGARLPAMDGLVRSVGDAFAGLLDGTAAAVGAAVGGAVDAFSSVAPPGLVPLAVIGLIILALVFRR